MGALDNLYVSSSFQGLLKMTDSANGLTNTLQTVQTGDGDNSPLQMSLTQVNISGSLFVNGVQILGSSSGTSGTSGSSGSSGTAGSSGTSGSSGSGFTYNGVWDNAVNYNVNDVVLYNGQTYVAIQANVNKQPSVQPTFWQVFSAAGSSGTSGTSGTSGSSGSSGTSGSSGSSGTNGATGATGSSGTSGSNGSSGTSGVDGSSGTSGTSGDSGSSGTSGVVDYTGLITTGSVTTTQNITGSIVLDRTTISGSLVNGTVNNGLLLVTNEAFVSGTLRLNVTSSLPVSQSNILLAPAAPNAAQAAQLTGSIVISGSQNILTNPFRTQSTGQTATGIYGYINGNGNIGSFIPLFTTASLTQRPSINNNQLQGQLSLGFITSSLGSTFNNNSFFGNVTVNSQSGSVGYSNNYNNQLITINQISQPLTGSGQAGQTFISTNLFGGSTTLNAISSSIVATSNITFGSATFVTNSFFQTGSNNFVNVQANIIGGNNNHIQFGGNPATNAARGFSTNIFGGGNSVVNLDATGSAGDVFNSIIYGNSLLVNPKQTITGLGVFGAFNKSITGSTIFVVGNGDSTANRKNAIEITNNNQTILSGSVLIAAPSLAGQPAPFVVSAFNNTNAAANITGSVTISGSLILNGVAISGGSGSSGTSGTSGVAGTSGSSGTSGVGGSSGTSGTSPSVTGFITTGSYTGPGIGQQLSGSLRMSSGSLLLDNGEDASKIADYFNRNTLYKQESTGKILIGGNCNMDQVNTDFGVTADSVGLTVIGGNTLNFRSGSYNTFIASGGSLRSGSFNTLIGASPSFTGGTGNFILGNFNNSLFNATNNSNVFSIGTQDRPSFIYKNDTNPLTIVSNTVVSGSIASTKSFAQVTLASNQTVTAAADATINFDTVDFDPNSWWNSTNKTFVPTIAGYYEFTAEVMIGVGTGNGQMNLQLNKNSGTQTFIIQDEVNKNINHTLTASKIIYMNGSTDNLKITFYTSSNSGSQDIQGGNGTLFNIKLL